MDKSTDKSEKFLLDLFFPKFCLGCKKEGTYLCDDCRGLLDINEFNYCLCDRPSKILQNQNEKTLRQGLRLSSAECPQGKCSKCQDKKLSGLYFALPYKDPSTNSGQASLTKKLIYQFKYQPYLRDLAETLASILIEHFVLSGKNTDDIWKDYVLIPVPLEKKKLKTRGYNQSEELARELSKVLQIPTLSDVLIKTKSTKPQMELKKEEREKNLENAFRIKNPSAIAQGKIFLVDDVYTTGSTMQECAKTLLETGVKQVWGICLAREG